MLAKSNRVDGAPETKRSMTEEQRHLWRDFLRSYSVSFKRNKVIGGNFADFYCPKAKLVVTLGETPQGDDAGVCGSFASLGLTELRFSNDEIRRNFVRVCEQIDKAVREAK